MRDTAFPRYQSVKATFAEIGEDEYAPDRPFITETTEVCRRFGVSRTTAIRALNDLMREGVLVRHPGCSTFVSNGSATVANGTTDGAIRPVGCIFQHLQGQHPMDIVRGIEHVCRAANYHLLLFDSMGEPDIEALNLQRARAANVHGLIIYPVDGFA